MQQYSTLLSQIWGTYSIIIPKPESSWWFQPLWKILVKLGNLPQVGVEIKNIWNHHPVNDQAKAFLEDISRIPFIWGDVEVRAKIGRLEFVKANFQLSNPKQWYPKKKISGGPLFWAAALSIAFIYIHGQVERHHGKRHLYHLLLGKIRGRNTFWT